MGEECPLPGGATFQRIFFFSFHTVGGFASGATPFASGPRHWGQYLRASGVVVCATQESATKTNTETAHIPVILMGDAVQFSCPGMFTFLTKSFDAPWIFQSNTSGKQKTSQARTATDNPPFVCRSCNS